MPILCGVALLKNQTHAVDHFLVLLLEDEDEAAAPADRLLAATVNKRRLDPWLARRLRCRDDEDVAAALLLSGDR